MSFRIIPFRLRVLKRSLNVLRKPTLPKLSFRDFSSDFSDQKGFEKSTKDQLMTILSETSDDNSDKITVVGTGDVGMACVVSILTQGISSDVAMIDMNKNKMLGNLYDLQHACLFLNAKISAGKGNDYSVSAGSKICVITAGVRQKEGESRLAHVQKNTDVLETIVPNLVKYSPDTIIIVVTNPVDILAYVAWKLSGLPKNRVFGSGTNLDSARFRFFISQKMGVAPANVHALIIGEHGDSSVPIWSTINVAGVRLKELNPSIGTEDDPEKWKNIHKDVVQSAYEVVKLKGYTNWAIGLSAANLCRSVLRNSNNIHPVSTDIKGKCGIKHEIFLSLPCTLASDGITSIIDPYLAEEERAYLESSAAKLAEIINGIKF